MDAPAVAVSNDGRRIAAAWMDMRSGRNDRDVQWTISSGGSFAPESTVHDVRTGTQGHPSLVLDRNGTAWCAWEDSRRGPNDTRIYVADSKSRKNVQLSSDDEGRSGYPSLSFAGPALGVAYETPAGVSFRLLNGE